MRRVIPGLVAATLTLTSSLVHADTLRMECPPGKESRQFCNDIKQ